MKTNNAYVVPVGAFLLFLFFPLYLSSQTTLTGIIIDEKTNPIPFANVLLLSTADSALVIGAVTSENGVFQLEAVNPGEYFLGGTMLGYETTHTRAFVINRDQATVALDPVVLLETATDLETVEVLAKKPLFQQEADRMVVNVQNSVTAAGNTALDILAKSPGVVVNQQTSTLGLNGKEGVIVMINGKRNRLPIAAVLQMLSGMNASNIEKIELITNPPANFDAEGNAGVINIVLLENNLEGFNGSFSLHTGMGVHEKYGGSFNFNYRKNKFNLFGSYGYQHNKSKQEFYNYRQIYRAEDLLTTASVNNRDPASQFNHTARLGFDLELSDRTVLGGILGGYDNTFEMNTVNSLLVEENEIPEIELGMRAYEKNHWRHAMGNINLQHTLTGDQVFNFDLDYLFYHNENPSRYFIESSGPQGNPLPWEQSRVEKVTPINVWVGRADYKAKIGEKVNWSTGIKGTVSRVVNEVSLETHEQADWILDPNFSQDYYLREDVAAAYSSFELNFSERTQLSLGLRYEYTFSNLGTEEVKDIVDRKYGNFFPTVTAFHQLKEHHSVQFAYGRRITRPSFNSLAPFVYFVDPFTSISGNINLQPTITDQVRLGYSFKNYSFAVQYSHDQNAIARFQPVIDPETNRQVQSSRNLDQINTVALTVSLPVYVNNWWEMQNSILGVWRQIDTKYDGIRVVQEQKNLQLNTVQTFRLPQDFTFELSAFFQSQPLLFGLWKFEPMGALNIGVQKTFSRTRSTLSLNVNDIFNTRKWKVKVDEPDLGIHIDGKYLFETRVVRLTFTQPFGKQKLKGTRKRTTGSDIEQSRVE